MRVGSVGLRGSVAGCLRRAFTLDSSYAGAYGNLAYALIQNQQPRDALTVLDHGIARFPSEKFLYKNAGLAALAIGDRAKAAKYLDRALEIDPEFREAQELEARAQAPR